MTILRFLTAIITLICCTVALNASAVAPSIPSFAADIEVSFIDYDFGKVRTGDLVAPLSFSIFNVDQSGDTVSSMSLQQVSAIGNADALVLQVPEIDGLLPGSGVTGTLSLTTDTPGFYQVSYILQFSSDDAPDSPTEGLAIAAFATVLPPGDFTGDGKVDIEDYNQWKSEYGTAGASDGNRNGIVDAADYVIWRNNLGTDINLAATTALDSLAVTATTVPEPATVFLLGSIVVVCVSRKLTKTKSG